MAKRLFLEDEHLKYGAKFFEFAGWWMPLEYSGTINEHLTVRKHVGIFDISHMGRILLKGQKVKNFVQYVTTNDVNNLYPGKAQYSLILNYDGTIKDDIIVYEISEEEFLLVVNAINTQKILDWLNLNNKFEVNILDLTNTTTLLAIQGPDSEKVLEEYFNLNLSNIKYYHFKKNHMIISRTGYTGEDGFEIVSDPEIGRKIFRDLVEKKKATPCGLGARNTLRIEMGYALYGHEIDENTTPWEANLGWVVKLNKGDFIGKDSLVERKTKKEKILKGFVMLENGIPRDGYEVYLDKERIGYITSGTFSPMLKMGIGMLYTTKDINHEILIKIREKFYKAKIEKPPFVKNTSIKKGER
ncbi:MULTISPECIES: glycine cleavage system aminomethyltransferase GcvT [Dictyoglomus]|jgi:aminomethyltransferase|uniref:Aminomethyltransferase n=1 Tax=Dictyoglomus turgidum (strain DSM 6724 / Z-1310) TaxID=515635 RepID=B8E2E5_DICTD|nr:MULTISPECIES: glycine cleavage system aminomethyltransferase GcvT [Dictyoglomus]ACK42789.1 glycine cleavage system T protein [Dictyoglomus turgidum DSM 6724]PNV81003.1 MAG: glycine cleavage system protein T [Dictyoglomus turgidum]HBU30848.1 glycine cleavage system aminomethyltransferase GcvT [Dictyoglomus sp.]